MNKFAHAAALACLALSFAGGAHAAEDVAVCEPGFAIEVTGANRAVCVKTQNVEDDLGARRCAADGRRTQTEAADGGDMCQGTATALNSLLVGPALDCKLSHGLSARNKLVPGGQDRCVKTVQRKVRGDISVRHE